MGLQIKKKREKEKENTLPVFFFIKNVFKRALKIDMENIL